MDFMESDSMVPMSQDDTITYTLANIITFIVDDPDLIEKMGIHVADNFTQLLALDVISITIQFAFTIVCPRYLDDLSPKRYLLFNIYQQLKTKIKPTNNTLLNYWKTNINGLIKASFSPHTRYCIDATIKNQIKAIRLLYASHYTQHQPNNTHDTHTICADDFVVPTCDN